MYVVHQLLDTTSPPNHDQSWGVLFTRLANVVTSRKHKTYNTKYSRNVQSYLGDVVDEDRCRVFPPQLPPGVLDLAPRL